MITRGLRLAVSETLKLGLRTCTPPLTCEPIPTADATVHGFNAAFDLAATVAEDAAVDRADAAMRNDFAAQAHAAVDCLDLAGACAVGHFHPAVDGIDTAGFRAFANADTAVDRIQLAVALAGFGADAAVDLADVVLGAGRAGCEQDAQQQRNGKITGKPLRDNAFPSRRHHIAAARGGRCLLLALAIALALPLPAAAQSTRETERKLQKLRTELKGVAQERRQIEGQRGQASQQLREADEKVARSGRALAQTETALPACRTTWPSSTANWPACCARPISWATTHR
ncbi:hypothetical protein G6F35_012333 [Rhizopus arrhizus]|nr:hypothetical protein G6F35_012333 [Rhizopus arrhizus]